MHNEQKFLAGRLSAGFKDQMIVVGGYSYQTSYFSVRFDGAGIDWLSRTVLGNNHVNNTML